MKTSTINLVLPMLFAVGLMSASAGTILVGDSIAGGVPYAREIQLNAADSVNFSSHVGAWSWEDEALFTPGTEAPVGWTHTSNWIAVTLTSDATLNLSVTRDAAVAYAGSGNIGGFAGVDSMFPSFTIWRHLDNDDADFHTYNNRGNVAWAEDLVYLDHIENSTNPTSGAAWVLAAGSYSIAIGSNAPALEDSPRQGYGATLTTSPVPEPGVTVLAALGLGLGLTRRARRRLQA
jgi:hypothetical protein